MRRLYGLTAGSLLGWVFAVAGAAAGSVNVASSTGRDTYQSTLSNIVDELTALSASYVARSSGNATGIELRYNPGENRNVLSGNTGFNMVDADWARANLRLYDLYMALGGNEIAATQQFRRNGSQYYVGLDGTGGQSFASLDDAQGYMVKLLIERSAEILEPVKTALSGLASNGLAGVVAQARTAMLDSRGILAQGSDTAITITGAGFSNTNGAPVVIGPKGITVTDVTFVSATQVQAAVRVDSTATAGAGRLHVFNAGQPFVAVDGADILVVSGTGTASVITDDHGATVGTATAITPTSTTAGRIAVAGDVDLFAVTLPGAGTLTLSSSGTSDVKATLEDNAGTVIAGNDDGGAWYNFSFSQALTAGTYFVRVSHCCQGTGSYTLNAAFN